MEKFRKKLLVLILLAAGFAVSMTAWAQHKPGAFFIGDADGDGIISGYDYSAMAAVLGNPSLCDDEYTKVHPADCRVADLDGSGNISCGDITIWNYWFTGIWIPAFGGPQNLYSDADFYIQHGTSNGTISAYVLGNYYAPTGWGVIFKVTDEGTCSGAKLYGRLVSSGDDEDWGTSVFEYSGLDGKVELMVDVPAGCDPDETIKVEFYIPDDTEAYIPGHRFPNKLDPGYHITVTVTD